MEPQSSSPYPIYSKVENKPKEVNLSYHVLSKDQTEVVPELFRDKFTKEQQVSVHEGLSQTVYLTPKKASKITIDRDAYVQFSTVVSSAEDFYGVASDLLSSPYKFSRKQKKVFIPSVHVNQFTKDIDSVFKLVETKNRAKELANGRGDEDGVPATFERLAQAFSSQHKLQITVFKGKELLTQGFRLMHAVGRASKNQPTFINIKYQGNPDSKEWIAFVGKGVCFDSGGLNVKATANIKDMYLDKHGAVSVFSAFQTLVEEKAKINLTVSMGFVQNFISSNSYRPSDIITSRKGISVQIGNTDAEGRLVLADCMHWTQQKYKPSILIELSTLTGAILISLGHKYAGLFGNDDNLKNELKVAGKQINQQVWEMPVTQYHHELIKHKFGDITNSTGRQVASSSQAAAFLQNFVQEGVKWVHLDIYGTAIVNQEGTGYGARLLVQYARNHTKL